MNRLLTLAGLNEQVLIESSNVVFIVFDDDYFRSSEQIELDTSIDIFHSEEDALQHVLQKMCRNGMINYEQLLLKFPKLERLIETTFDRLVEFIKENNSEIDRVMRGNNSGVPNLYAITKYYRVIRKTIS